MTKWHEAYSELLEIKGITEKVYFTEIIRKILGVIVSVLLMLVEDKIHE